MPAPGTRRKNACCLHWARESNSLSKCYVFIELVSQIAFQDAYVFSELESQRVFQNACCLHWGRESKSLSKFLLSSLSQSFKRCLGILPSSLSATRSFLKASPLSKEWENPWECSVFSPRRSSAMSVIYVELNQPSHHFCICSLPPRSCLRGRETRVPDSTRQSSSSELSNKNCTIESDENFREMPAKMWLLWCYHWLVKRPLWLCGYTTFFFFGVPEGLHYHWQGFTWMCQTLHPASILLRVSSFQRFLCVAKRQ